MTVLQLITAPNPIFKKKAALVEKVDDSIRKIIDDMFETLDFEHAVGIGANMVGILKRIIVVNSQAEEETIRYGMVNPEIIWSSEKTQTFSEGSLSFPGIDAEITRPEAIKISYLDYDGKPQELESEGWLATVIQHEVEYLDGKVFLDHLSRTKRDVLMRKMQKFIKQHPPHVHGEHCNH